MQPKSTHGSVVSFCLRLFAMVLVFLTAANTSFSQNAVGASGSDNDLGRPNKATKGVPVQSKLIQQTDRTAACTFSGSLGAGDPTLSTRLFRGGVGSVCGATQAYPGTTGAGPYYYDTYSIRNTTGACQCVTFTLTSSDATANIQFAVYNGSFNPANLATNYLADPGLSTGTPPGSLSTQATIANGQDLVLVVFTVGASQPASNYSLAVNNLNCNPPASCAFSGALTGTDTFLNQRLVKSGLTTVCGAANAYPGATGAGPYYYDTYNISNTTGATQCVTFTLTNTDPSTDIMFALYNGTFNPANLATNYLADPGTSSGVPGVARTINYSVPNGANLVIVVFGVNASEVTGGYTVSVNGLPCNCAGTPAPGNTVSCNNPVCSGVAFGLSLQNNPFSGGFTYQWQSSPDNVTYTNIAGATASTTTRTQAVATWYRCVVTCVTSGLSANSTPLQITMNPVTSCYCAAGSTDVVFEKISNVTFNTINNNSTSTGGYENFTAIGTTVVQSQKVPISITLSNGFSSDQGIVWIDFNQDGDFFDAGEQVFISQPGAGPFTGLVTIPANAPTGTTRMRIRMHDTFGALPNATPCGNSDYGQVEDYSITIAPCIQGVFTTQPANTTTTCGSNATITFAATGSVLSYQWQEKVSAAAAWTTVTNGGVYSGATTTSLTLTNCPVSMNGYQYRAVLSGPCTAIDFSTPVTLTVNPLIATVNPTSATICTGTIQPITITNITSAPATSTFASGPIAVAIPDASATGANHTINVSTIPAGSVITNMSVKFTIPHTWVGDLVMVLKAPNGQILNLDYFLSGTGGAGVTTGFSNTIISSSGTAALSSGSNPYTGTFKADAATTATFGPLGPTGFTPTTSTWAPLWSTPNGNYTLAIYDGGGGDVGTLTSWSVDITFVAPVFATGTWTSAPAAPNTIFTDAAATVPYVAGTPVTTVYVKPLVNTSYSVVVQTATCTTPPTVVPVNVTNPVTAVVQPANTAVCVGKNASFTVSAAGGPLTYQWQVSNNSGLTYTSISGANSATYVVTGATASLNNYLYRCVITAAPCGSVTSNAGRLTVNPLPTVTITTPTTQLIPGRTTTITAVSNPGALSTTSYSWTLNGSAVSGATGSSINVNLDQIGTYKATVTDINGCVNSSGTIEIGTEASDRLWLYPNPTSGIFQARLYYGSQLTEKRVVTVYTSTGVMVSKKEFTLTNVTNPYLEMDFDLSKYQNGVYVVEVTGSYTDKRISGLLVVQH